MKKNKSQRTAKMERAKVENPMWRKKVDNYLLETGTPIPKWVANNWELEKYFPGDNTGRLVRKDEQANVSIQFDSKKFYDNNYITRASSDKSYRLTLSSELISKLQSVFVMSEMRRIESQLQGNVGDIEKEIPFWEFLDIEFNHNSREFVFTDYYKQVPTFPLLFNYLSESPSMRALEDQIFNKKGFRIYKQDWKPKSNLVKEIGAKNVIYTLLDDKKNLIYIGEAKDLKIRLSQQYKSIPKWNYYRYDVLPSSASDEIRLSIERMVIRSYASLLENKRKIPTKNISQYKLANDKIDK